LWLGFVRFRLDLTSSSTLDPGKEERAGAEDVVGVKTHIAEIGHGLVEFMAIGTAVKKTAGVSVATPTLPVQAIVPDKDTWIDGDFGFQLDRANLSHLARLGSVGTLSRPRFLLVKRARRRPAQMGKINNLRVRRSD
jgi:hypothetical protein